MLIKLGEATTVTANDIQPLENVLADHEILEKFKKFAAELKSIAPAAKDFLYFTAVMMHAAEAALLDENGEIKKDASGNYITANWEQNGESLRWVCSDTNIRPYRNANLDIFPESELVKAHKKWIGRPLCLDHKSASVDMIRGVIVDTYYDRKLRRVVALCALDKLNYADLARKVATGYAASVSMGTGVGKAICSDCGKVAKVESDFCNHMRSKSCYGEINVDLSPIELSIVVNGADPKAKIKHIIAKDLSKAAAHIDEYIKNKLSQGNASKEELATIKQDFISLSERFEQLIQKASDPVEDENDAIAATRSTAMEAGPEIETSDVQQQTSPPAPVSAQLTDLRQKVSQIQENLNKLMKMSEESTMTTQKKAYYQGTVEPTPGRPQYAKEDYETIRDTQDKQMVGQPPFPEVGPVDGMYPGYESFGESEEARKKRLQRLAELKDRQIRRQAALQKAKDSVDSTKEAYWQGTEEPTPGKAKYPKDPLNEKDRDHEDKQMVGQSPFPGVGAVDGLHPSPASVSVKDEEKRKEMLARASLKAKFLKASSADGQPDKSNSCWQVYSGDNLILTATVDEITRGNTDALYDSIATKDFGLSMISKIKTEGFEKAKSMYKSSQGAAPMMGAPATPADAMPAPAALPANDAMPPLDEPVGGGGSDDSVGNIAADVRDLADEVAKRADDLAEAADKVGGDAEELADVPPAGDAAFADMPKAASLKQLQRMRKSLNGMLGTAIKENVEALQAHAKELRIAAGLYDTKWAEMNNSQRKYLNTLVSDAMADAKVSMADSLKIMASFVKYAHGTVGLKKRAAHEMALKKQALSTGSNMNKNAQVAPNPPAPAPTPVMPGAPVAKPLPVMPQQPVAAADDGAADDGDKAAADSYAADDKEMEKGASFDLTTKEGRALYRAKLAKGLQYSDMLDKAHPGKLVTPGGIDTKPSGDLGEVETLEATKDAMMGLVNATPKVKKQAKRIADLVASGSLPKDKVDDLIAEGVDPEAVRYYKELWSDSDAEAKGWASELTKDHVAKKASEQLEVEHVRIKRAYDLAYEMRERGMIEESQVKQQVDEILKWNDAAFESTKRIVAKQASLRKSAMPQVGLLSSAEVILPAASTSEVENVDYKDLFEGLFAGKRL